MKFPICYCVKTEWLDFNSYCLLVAKLGTEGYKNPYEIGGGGKDAFSLGGFIGVNDNGDIMCYDDPEFYLPIDESSKNVLSKQWLEEYLSE